jgi:membrane-bound lytic murein transglycosylase F
MLKNFGKFLLGLILSGVLLFAAASCDQPLFRNDLEAIQARGILRVITRNNGTCFYEGPHGHEGFEYDLVQTFADYLGLELELVIIDNEKVMVTELLKGNADLIAANFIVKDDLRKHLAFGPISQEMHLLVIGKPGGPAPRSVADLIGQPIWVRAGAFHERRLNTLKKEYPDLSWLAVSDYESEELLEMAWRGTIPLTIADSLTVAINRKYYPELTIHFAIDESQNLAWVMDPKNTQLRDTVNLWFTLQSTVSLLERLNQHYYGHLESFDYTDIKIFRKRLLQRLPRYRKYFEAAALENGLDWKLIAAQAYQESHWNPRAKSFTGVRGLMMLTKETARDMGVKNRLDPVQSIFGGTQYLASLYDRVGDQVEEPDRMFMALAAYNVGWGHLEDARKLCVRFGKNPNTWSDVRSTLPLLRLKKYYKKLPHGYARGAEPVRYVDRIRTYHEVIDHSERVTEGH